MVLTLPSSIDKPEEPTRVISVFDAVQFLDCFNEGNSSPLSANTLVMSYESACITFRRNYFIIRVSIDLLPGPDTKDRKLSISKRPSFRDTNYLG